MKTTSLFLATATAALLSPTDAAELVCKSDSSGKMTCDDPDASAEEDENPTEAEPEFECRDLDDKCPAYVAGVPGVCESNSSYMTYYCPKTCDECDVQIRGYEMSKKLSGGLSSIPYCQDNNFDCQNFAKSGECDKNPEYMKMFCKVSCGICSEDR